MLMLQWAAIIQNNTANLKKQSTIVSKMIKLCSPVLSLSYASNIVKSTQNTIT